MLSLGIVMVLADLPVAALVIVCFFHKLLIEPLWILALSLSIFSILFAQFEKLESLACSFCFVLAAALLKFLVDYLTFMRPVGEHLGLTLYSFY